MNKIDNIAVDKFFTIADGLQTGGQNISLSKVIIDCDVTGMVDGR